MQPIDIPDSGIDPTPPMMNETVYLFALGFPDLLGRLLGQTDRPARSGDLPSQRPAPAR